jgi:hypothetical protein
LLVIGWGTYHWGVAAISIFMLIFDEHKDTVEKLRFSQFLLASKMGQRYLRGHAYPMAMGQRHKKSFLCFFVSLSYIVFGLVSLSCLWISVSFLSLD